MAFERGIPQKARTWGRTPNRRGTASVSRTRIFGAKAASAGAAVPRWRARRRIVRRRRDPLVVRQALLAGVDDVPEQETFHFERADRLLTPRCMAPRWYPDIFAGKVGTGAHGAVEWAVACRGRGWLRVVLLQHDPDP
jgi:hypothetical protein